VNASPREVTATSESLVVLTHDDVLLDTLRAVATEHEISSVGAEADLAAHLLDDHAGVALLDTAAVTSPIARLTERLKAQFPELVLVVAGGVEDQGALAAQITNGTVYRFLHKPVSEQRVKLFVDAAWRRHGVEHAGVTEQITAPRRAARPRPASGAPLKPGMWVGIGAAVLAVAGIAWFASQSSGPSTSGSLTPAGTVQSGAATASDPVMEQLLSLADTAFKNGVYVAPPAENAADLYRQALERNGNEQRAREGLEQVMDQLLSLAEKALLEERTEDATGFTEAARSIQPDHVRVAFLTTQIGKERERTVLSQARRAASSGNVERAIAVLDDAAKAGPRSTLVAEARNEFEQQKVDDRVREFLRRATNRIRSGALVEPAQDNARFFIESARAIAPNDPGVRRSQQQLQDRVLTSARTALNAGNADEADDWIAAAGEAGISRDEVASLTREAQRLRIATRADSMARLSQSFNQRLTQGRLVEPTDSAKFFLTQLTQAEANHPSTQLARNALNARLLDEARGALGKQDFAGARRWITEAREAGADAAGTAALERDMQTAQESARRVNEVVSARSLRQTRNADPEYPALARERGTSGWVDVEFTVRSDGTVSDITVAGAEPAGVFEQSALSAVRKWRYEPILRNGQPVDQRAKLRIRFAITQ
jgi:TonB family protein